MRLGLVKMLAFIVMSLTVVQVQAVDDTPFSNFPYKFNDVEGECNPVKAMKASADESKYEGRWIMLYYGFGENQDKAINCFAWDIYFDKNGNYRNFVHLYLDGNKKLWRNIGIPVDKANGIYDWVDGRGKPKTESKLMNTFFYINDEGDLLAYVVYECLPGQNKHKVNMGIALRHLEDEEKYKDLIEAIYKEFEARGGKTLRKRAKHENCKYQEKFKKHPYKN